MKFPKIPHALFLLGPVAMMATGFLLNALVVAANGGQMPVLWPGGCTSMVTDTDDIVHSCMTHATHLTWLADWIVMNHVGVASPGDFFEWAFEASFIPALIAWVVLIIHDHQLK